MSGQEIAMTEICSKVPLPLREGELTTNTNPLNIGL
jgi:hypothetical protein